MSSKKNKHPSIYYKLMLKVLKHNWKSLLRFFTSAVLAVMLVFTFVSVRDMVSEMLSGSQTLGSNRQIQGLLTQGIQIVGIITIFLMAFTLQYYMRSRSRERSLYKMLGMRPSDLDRLLIVEYGGSMIIAFAIGLLLGEGVVFGFCKVIRGYFPGESIFMPGWSTYVITVIWCLGIMGLSIAVNKEVSEETNLTAESLGMIDREERPKGKKRLLCFGGILLMLAGGYLFAQRSWGEFIGWIWTFVIGIYLMLWFGGSYILDFLKKKPSYFGNHMVCLGGFYHKYGSSMKHITILFVFQFFLLFYIPSRFIPILSTQPIDDLYPYDFICKVESESEKDITNQLRDLCEADISSIPAVKLITLKGDDSELSWKSLYNQGQNLAIPVSAYNLLTGKDTQLSGNQMLILYQQSVSDIGHPLDYYGSRVKPYYYMGAPIFFPPEEYRDYSYHDEEIVKEAREILIGYYGNGYNENVVVMSDEFFDRYTSLGYKEERVKQLLELPTLNMQYLNKKEWGDELRQGLDELKKNRLLLIHVPEDKQIQAGEILKEYEKQNSEELRYDSRIHLYYDSRDTKKTVKSEHILQALIYGLLYVALAFGSFLIMYEKASSEVPLIRKKMQYFECMGVNYRNCRKAILREYTIYAVLPLGLAIVSAAIFTLFIWNIRFYTTTEIIHYLDGLKIWGGGYLVLWIVMSCYIRRMLMRSKEGYDNGNNRSKES